MRFVGIVFVDIGEDGRVKHQMREVKETDLDVIKRYLQRGNKPQVTVGTQAPRVKSQQNDDIKRKAKTLVQYLNTVSGTKYRDSSAEEQEKFAEMLLSKHEYEFIVYVIENAELYSGGQKIYSLKFVPHLVEAAAKDWEVTKRIKEQVQRGIEAKNKALSDVQPKPRVELKPVKLDLEEEKVELEEATEDDLDEILFLDRFTSTGGMGAGEDIGAEQRKQVAQTDAQSS